MMGAYSLSFGPSRPLMSCSSCFSASAPAKKPGGFFVLVLSLASIARLSVANHLIWPPREAAGLELAIILTICLRRRRKLKLKPRQRLEIVRARNAFYGVLVYRKESFQHACGRDEHRLISPQRIIDACEHAAPRSRK